MDKRDEAERLLELFRVQWDQARDSRLTDAEAYAAYKRFNETKKQILELMGVD